MADLGLVGAAVVFCGGATCMITPHGEQEVVCVLLLLAWRVRHEPLRLELTQFRPLSNSTFLLISFLAVAATASPWQHKQPERLQLPLGQKPLSSSNYDSTQAPRLRLNLSFKAHKNDEKVSTLAGQTLAVLLRGLFVDLATLPDQNAHPVEGMKLLLDTGSDISWIAREGCTSPGRPCEFPPADQYLNANIPANSLDPVTPWNVLYGPLGVSGLTMTTYMAIGDDVPRTFERMSIGLANNINIIRRAGEAGLLGLEPDTGNRWQRVTNPGGNLVNVLPLWIQAADAASTPRRFAIAVWENAQHQLRGQFEIGGTLSPLVPGIPGRDMTANLIPTNNNGVNVIDRWLFNMRISLFVKGKPVVQVPLDGGNGPGNPFEATLDSGAAVILLHHQAIHAIHGANAVNGVLQPGINRYVVDCALMRDDSPVYLVVSLDSANMQRVMNVPSKRWVVPRPNVPGECLTTLESKAAHVPAIFGMPWFLWAGKTVFDLNAATITVTPKD
ncbi:hypothetical protein B0H63DRAFT_507137 [Podospora didyma]|uniref:Peptidase A1 domain-containing protein n=1 Tax=Podospora didyma TaxID=330526 RepID=A0AAE0NXL2_9PEZI|nr:hypothetical protein B0H63DRAFT_507137 [Podospora didyma]